MTERYRVIQWGTGNVGHEALQAILLHPQLELAGVKVFTDEKEGVDAGRLCGMPDTGILATTDRDALLACEADCVAYMPRNADLDDVCDLLASGKNVVSTPFLFYAEARPEAERERLRAACEAGRSSVYGTGINPGAIGLVLPITLSAMCRTIDHVLVQERADWSFYNSPRITFDNMRFGYPPDEATLDANPFARFNSSLFEEQVAGVAAALGAALDEVTVTQDLRTAEERIEVMAGHVDPGTVCAQRYRWCGIRDGRTLVEVDALWTLGCPYPEDWPRPDDGWTVTIEGDPSSRTHFIGLASLERPDATMEDHVHAADIATAMQAVNSIPALCRAAPGLRAAHELQVVVTGIGFRPISS